MCNTQGTSVPEEKAYAPRMTELDLLILADIGVGRELVNDESAASWDCLSEDVKPPASG